MTINRALLKLRHQDISAPKHFGSRQSAPNFGAKMSGQFGTGAELSYALNSMSYGHFGTDLYETLWPHYTRITFTYAIHCTIKDINDSHCRKIWWDSVVEWSDKYLLKFNVEKCKIMHIGHEINTQYNMKDKDLVLSLSTTNEERDNWE